MSCLVATGSECQTNELVTMIVGLSILKQDHVINAMEEEEEGMVS